MHDYKLFLAIASIEREGGGGGGGGEGDEGKKEKGRELFRTQIQDKVEIAFY